MTKDIQDREIEIAESARRAYIATHPDLGVALAAHAAYERKRKALLASWAKPAKVTAA